MRLPLALLTAAHTCSAWRPTLYEGRRPASAGQLRQDSVPLVAHVVYDAPDVEGDFWKLWSANMAKFPEGTQLRYYNHGNLTSSACRISRQLSDAGIVDGAYEAFASLRPIAFKVDLWRYMVLWDEGGYYFDHKMEIQSKVADWMGLDSPNTLRLIKDIHPGFFNAVMAAPPRHPLLARILRAVVATVKARRYPEPHLPQGDPVLAITGPEALAEALGLAVEGVPGNWSVKGFGTSDDEGKPAIIGELDLVAPGRADVMSLAGASPRRVLCTISESLHSMHGHYTWYGLFVQNKSVYDESPPPPCKPE